MKVKLVSLPGHTTILGREPMALVVIQDDGVEHEFAVFGRRTVKEDGEHLVVDIDSLNLQD